MRSAVRSSIVAAVLLIVAAAMSAQATVSLGGAGTLTVKGFVSFTAFAQDQSFNFGNGQNAEYPIAPNCEVDCWFGGGDVRNTRLTLAFDGPKLFGDWKAGATVEMDFFGGFGGSTNSSFIDQQPVPRLRLGYVDLTNGSTTIRMGQMWAPLFGNTAVSLSHIAFPLGYGSAGDIGWRFPGIFVYQDITAKDAPFKVDAVAAIMSGSWNGPECATTSNCVNYLTAGNASWPQFELRFNVSGKFAPDIVWSTYIVGHVDEKDLSGAGASTSNDKLTGSAIELGGKIQIGPVMLQGNGYSGHAIGQNFGMLTQFGRIQGEGGWGQVGFDVTKNWSLFGFYGFDDPKNEDVLKAIGDKGRMKNEMFAGMVRWKSGPLALGFEYMWDRLKTGALEVKTSGQQLALSALYNF